MIQVLGPFFIALISACAPSYFGNTYPATQNVDVYLDAADVKKEHKTIGTAKFDKGLRSLEALQQKAIEMGKAKGADGVIMELTEEVTATQQAGTGIVNKKSKVISTSGTSVNIKKKKIVATFIKYS